MILDRVAVRSEGSFGSADIIYNDKIEPFLPELAHGILHRILGLGSKKPTMNCPGLLEAPSAAAISLLGTISRTRGLPSLRLILLVEKDEGLKSPTAAALTIMSWEGASSIAASYMSSAEITFFTLTPWEGDSATGPVIIVTSAPLYSRSSPAIDPSCRSSGC